MTNGEGSLLQIIGAIVVAVWTSFAVWVNSRFNSLKDDHKRLSDQKLSKNVFVEFKESNKEDHKRQEKMMGDFTKKQEEWMKSSDEKEDRMWKEIHSKQDR